jgi:hypothetical protein
MIYTHKTVLISIGVILFSMVTFGADSQSPSQSDKLADLNAARPLNHHVHVTRMGRVLKLDYQLIGSGGKKHSLWDINDQSKPKFAIYHNSVQVDAGVFEFG